MPFVPHSEADVEHMLATIGVDNIDDLFDEIPQHLANGRLDDVPAGVSELGMMQRMQARAALDDGFTCFLGAGSYDHHIPAAVWDITSRGEFMTAYTPYQAEASQGTLQLIYEFQSMMATLTGMDVSNASVYDGASGLGEAVLMAVRANKKNKSNTVAIADSVHPNYSQATNNIVKNQGIEIVSLPVDGAMGTAQTIELETPPAAVVIQQPNFFGALEAVDHLTDWAHSQGSLVVAVVNPMSLAVLKSPRDWGENGADIVCGDGQPFGVPMASGGPSFGFVCARQALVRQMPGRIIGRTEDLDGKVGYALTLQAREQHIRRGKATSNICTNQGLLVTAGTIYLSLLGPQGLFEVATKSHANANQLKQGLLEIDGIELTWPSPTFHEFVVSLPVKVAQLLPLMQQQKILAGLDLADFVGHIIPQADNKMLVAVTEKRTEQEIQAFLVAIKACLGQLQSGASA